jgi:hypothetical protein
MTRRIFQIRVHVTVHFAVRIALAFLGGGGVEMANGYG